MIERIKQLVRRARFIAFGGVERHKEDGRDARGTRFIEDLSQDIRYAARQLRASPGFAAAILVTLGLGIALSTAMFSVVNVAVLDPFPFDNPDRLVLVKQYSPKQCATCEYTAGGNYWSIHEQARSLESVSLVGQWDPVIRGSEHSDVLRGSRVTAEFFHTLRLRPMLGRVFAPTDTLDGIHTLIINETLWRSRFAADTGIIGRSVILDGIAFTVAGVVSSENAFPAWSQIWAPLVLSARERAERHMTNYQVFARLRDGVTYESAEVELATIGARVARAFPTDVDGYTFGLVPLAEWQTGGTGQLYLFAGAVALVLLIACLNLASLLIARLTVRRREIAVRAAMGAGTSRIARQLLTETVLLSVLGGAMGSIGAAWIIRLARTMPPSGIADRVPGWARLHVDARALVFALGVGLMTGLAIGLWPALRFSRPDMVGELKDGARSATPGAATRFRRSLLTVQIALSVVLLSVAGLIGRSVEKMYSAPRGFRGDHVLSVRVQLPEKFTGPADPELFDRLVAELKAIPGVEDGAATIALPLSFSYSSNTFSVDGEVASMGARRLSSRMQPVTPDYFSVMQVPIIRGRPFNDGDRAAGPRVAIVNEAFAAKFLPGVDPIGHALVIDDKRWEIVGVNRNVYYMRTNRRAEPEVYRPMRQWPSRWGHVALRTRGDPAHLGPAVSRAIRKFEADMGVSRIATMDQLLSDALASDRLMLEIVVGFAFAATLISAIGLYAVISYSVAQRTREFGVRLALGADSGSIWRMVLANGVRVAGIGAAAGVVVALAVSHFIRSQLFGVTSTDPATYASVVVGVIVLAAVASYIPARRAARVDPMTSLRND
ncbi:MAG TPA: ABC transporter permease [Gemmatimonadaceae bacterium]|nr:ABC transporter permease [Gemmatimonadaceae bacterium]